MKTIETLFAELKENESLQKSLAEALQSNALDAFLTEQGCDASAEEFAAAVKAQAEQLSEEELAAVAGGMNFTEGLISCLSVGLGCAAAAVASAIDSGTGSGGENGCLLCHSGIWTRSNSTFDQSIEEFKSLFQED